jgi:Tfp pilus assembly protein PilZ
MEEEFSEKRHSKRVPLTLSVKGKLPETLFHSKFFQGETRDISYEGLCIKTDNSSKFKAGQEVRLKIRLYPGDFFLKAKGNVCWVRDLPDPDWPINMGVKIIHMRSHRRWVERIENKIIEAIVGKNKR